MNFPDTQWDINGSTGIFTYIWQKFDGIGKYTSPIECLGLWINRNHECWQQPSRNPTTKHEFEFSKFGFGAGKRNPTTKKRPFWVIKIGPLVRYLFKHVKCESIWTLKKHNYPKDFSSKEVFGILCQNSPWIMLKTVEHILILDGRIFKLLWTFQCFCPGQR